MTTTTSRAAYHSLSPTRKTTVREKILQIVEGFGPNGCVYDDLRASFPSPTPDGSIHGRIVELERDALIFRHGDTRVAPSGCEQLVIRLAKYSSVPLTPIVVAKKNPFLEGMKRAAKIILQHSDFDTAKRELKLELLKVAKR